MTKWQEWADGAPLAELAALAAVLDQGSFTKAARLLQKDATVVSRRVRALEERLGVQLLQRTTRRVTATEAGLGFAERSRAILDELTEAESEASRHTTESPRGTLRVALPGTFGRLWVAPRLPELMAKNPKLDIDAQFSNRYVDVVAERFDAALRLGELGDSGLVARKVASQRRVLCASPAYLAKHGTPRTPKDLARHSCLGFTGLATHPLWNLVGPNGARATVRANGALASNEAEALVAATLAGRGIMMGTDWLVGTQLRSGQLTAVLPEWSTDERSAIYLIFPSGRFIPAKTRAFADWLTGLFLPMPPWSATPAKRTRR